MTKYFWVCWMSLFSKIFDISCLLQRYQTNMWYFAARVFTIIDFLQHSSMKSNVFIGIVEIKYFRFFPYGLFVRLLVSWEPVEQYSSRRCLECVLLFYKLNSRGVKWTPILTRHAYQISVRLPSKHQNKTEQNTYEEEIITMRLQQLRWVTAPLSPRSSMSLAIYSSVRPALCRLVCRLLSFPSVPRWLLIETLCL